MELIKLKQKLFADLGPAANASSLLSIDSNSLQIAFVDQQLCVHYLPQLQNTDGAVYGIKALLRWQHPDHGLLQAQDFLPLAEQQGLMNAYGYGILARALDDFGALSESYDDRLSLTIPISLGQLKDEHLSGRLSSLFLAYHIDASQLIFELPPAALIEDHRALQDNMSTLAWMGVRFALDADCEADLMLSRIDQVSIIKVSKLLVERLTQAPASRALLSKLDELSARRFWMVAEGVENEHQFKALKNLSFNGLQGFFLSKPLAFDDLQRVLR